MASSSDNTSEAEVAMTDPSKISELIERSSLGTTEARSLRDRTPPKLAQRILDRAAEHERTTEDEFANAVNHPRVHAYARDRAYCRDVVVSGGGPGGQGLIDARRVADLARAADEAAGFLSVEAELQVALWELVVDCEVGSWSAECLVPLDRAIAELGSWTDLHGSSAVLVVLVAELEHARAGLPSLAWGADPTLALCRAAAVWEAAKYVATSPALREAANDLLTSLESAAPHSVQQRDTRLVVLELTKVRDHTGSEMVGQLLRLFGAGA
jgi:hypothetical protein